MSEAKQMYEALNTAYDQAITLIADIADLVDRAAADRSYQGELIDDIRRLIQERSLKK